MSTMSEGKTKYTKIYDDEWVQPTPQRGHLMRCCDCGLVHVMDFRIRNGKVQFRPKRDNRRTAASRQKKRKTP